MPDAGNAIELDLSSSEVSVFSTENGRSNFRYVLGYVAGEFNKIKTNTDLYLSVYFKRNTDMQWENTTFQLNRNEKIFKQKLPPGLLVISFYLRLFGWVSEELEIVSLKCSVKEIPVGKFGGESLLLLEEEFEPLPPSAPVQFIPFELNIPLVGDLKANQATVNWATTHRASGRIIYGKTPETMTEEIFEADFIFYHSIVLEGLELEEEYYCQIYSVSEISGEEIHSDIIQFSTGKEITIQSSNIIREIDFFIRQKQELFYMNKLSETETLLTNDPDADLEAITNDAYLSLHNKTEILAVNKIGSEYTYSVTP